MLSWTKRVAIILGVALIGIGGHRLWSEGLSTETRQEILTVDFQRRTDLVASGAPLTSTSSVPEGEAIQPPEDVSVAEDADDPRFIQPANVYTAGEIAALTPEGTVLPGILHEFPPQEGEALGRIIIPSIDLDWMIVEGVELEYLAAGPGHMPWTAVPGQPGNAVISGHRTTHGAPFFDLDLLKKGDLIMVETLTGTHTYEVYESMIVDPKTGVWVVHPWQGAWLTLTTCNPKYSARERYVVFAQLIDGPNFETIDSLIESVPPSPPEGA